MVVEFTYKEVMKMKIALVGNQNSGKTTLFNILTGMNAKIGNWPGVTIEKKTGFIIGTKHEITDLPGIYSLSPYTTEEEVSRRFVFEEKPEIIINIIDSTALERSLYLTTQLLELDCKVIVALNMTDILAKKGIIVNSQKLEQMLGISVIKISALKKTGIKDLIREIEEKNNKAEQYIYDSKIENAIKQVENNLPKNSYHKRFVAVKLIENDKRFEDINGNQIKEITQNLSKEYETDLEEIIATERYEFIEQVKKQTLTKRKIKETLSDKLDKVFLNKWLGLPIFILIMFMVYYLSVGVVGKVASDFIIFITNIINEKIKILLEQIGTSNWLVSLITDGIISGVGAVINFVPELIILFICISILETSGYMSRIALLLDKIFKKVGLNGKSLVPFILGSGCSVPGIMGTRIIENTKEREKTIILTPFIPCSAKLPIITLFSSYFFKQHSGIVSVSLYFLAIIIIIVSAFAMKKMTSNNVKNTYISELPEYKLPSVEYITKDVFEKVTAFIKRAGSVILICSIIIWFLLSFSINLKYGTNIENSILAQIGKSISWIFKPMLGINSWEATVSIIQGLIAKEQVISSMSVISELANNTKNNIFEINGSFGFFTASSAYAFMVFNLFSAPCFGAIAAMKRELGSNRKLAKAIIFQITFAWCLGTLIYQIGNRMENKSFTTLDVVVFLIIIGLFIFIIDKMKEKTKCESRLGLKKRLAQKMN